MKSAEQKAKKVPAIRFAGFDDAWVEKKLSELATMHARIGWQNLRTSEFLDAGDYMLVTGTDFEDGKISFSTCHYVAKERYDQDKNIQIRNGSILITKDGTLGKVAFVQNLTKPATLNAGVFNVELKNKKETDEKYVFQYLKAPFLMDYVGNKATGGTIKHLNQNILVDFPVVSPKKEEQQKIGSFFSNIDSLISLEQKKYDKLTQVKKSMLEKMFPKEGATVPEIRFAGFTGKWRKVKIETIASFTRGNGLSWKDIVNNGKYECILYGHLYTDYGIIADSIKYKTNTIPLNAVYSRFGDVLIPGSDTTPTGLARATSIEKDDVLLGGDINVIRPHENINGNFLSLAINVNRNELIKLIKGTTVRHIHNSDIKDIELCVPSVMKEQEMLGNYFKNLDSLVSLQQRKLEKLKNIKKSLLEKMFV
jgi:type I restriction enzyme S subunit